MTIPKDRGEFFNWLWNDESTKPKKEQNTSDDLLAYWGEFQKIEFVDPNRFIRRYLHELKQTWVDWIKNAYVEIYQEPLSPTAPRYAEYQKLLASIEKLWESYTQKNLENALKGDYQAQFKEGFSLGSIKNTIIDVITYDSEFQTILKKIEEAVDELGVFESRFKKQDSEPELLPVPEENQEKPKKEFGISTPLDDSRKPSPKTPEKYYHDYVKDKCLTAAISMDEGGHCTFDVALSRKDYQSLLTGIDPGYSGSDDPKHNFQTVLGAELSTISQCHFENADVVEDIDANIIALTAKMEILRLLAEGNRLGVTDPKIDIKNFDKIHPGSLAGALRNKLFLEASLISIENGAKDFLLELESFIVQKKPMLLLGDNNELLNKTIDVYIKKFNDAIDISKSQRAIFESVTNDSSISNEFKFEKIKKLKENILNLQDKNKFIIEGLKNQLERQGDAFLNTQSHQLFSWLSQGAEKEKTSVLSDIFCSTKFQENIKDLFDQPVSLQQHCFQTMMNVLDPANSEIQAVGSVMQAELNQKIKKCYQDILIEAYESSGKNVTLIDYGVVKTKLNDSIKELLDSQKIAKNLQDRCQEKGINLRISESLQAIDPKELPIELPDHIDYAPIKGPSSEAIPLLLNDAHSAPIPQRRAENRLISELALLQHFKDQLFNISDPGISRQATTLSNRILKKYDDYLQEKTSPALFCSTQKGKETIQELKELKKLLFDSAKLNPVEEKKARYQQTLLCLFASNLHQNPHNASTIQAIAMASQTDIVSYTSDPTSSVTQARLLQFTAQPLIERKLTSAFESFTELFVEKKTQKNIDPMSRDELTKTEPVSATETVQRQLFYGSRFDALQKTIRTYHNDCKTQIGATEDIKAKPGLIRQIASGVLHLLQSLGSLAWQSTKKNDGPALPQKDLSVSPKDSPPNTHASQDKDNATLEHVLPKVPNNHVVSMPIQAMTPTNLRVAAGSDTITAEQHEQKLKDAVKNELMNMAGRPAVDLSQTAKA